MHLMQALNTPMTTIFVGRQGMDVCIIQFSLLCWNLSSIQWCIQSILVSGSLIVFYFVIVFAVIIIFNYFVMHGHSYKRSQLVGFKQTSQRDILNPTSLYLLFLLYAIKSSLLCDLSSPSIIYFPYLFAYFSILNPINWHQSFSLNQFHSQFVVGLGHQRSTILFILFVLCLQDQIKKMVHTIKIEKFTRTNSFNLLCMNMHALLKE